MSKPIGQAVMGLRGGIFNLQRAIECKGPQHELIRCKLELLVDVEVYKTSLTVSKRKKRKGTQFGATTVDIVNTWSNIGNTDLIEAAKLLEQVSHIKGAC